MRRAQLAVYRLVSWFMFFGLTHLLERSPRESQRFSLDSRPFSIRGGRMRHEGPAPKRWGRLSRHLLRSRRRLRNRRALSLAPGVVGRVLNAPVIPQSNPPLGPEPGQPFVSVTPQGPYDGGLFGGATPGSTTSGVQEAFNAVTSPTSPYFGFWVSIRGVLPFTTQITIPSGITIQMYQGGGEAFGPVLAVPASYLNFVGPASVGVPVLIPDQSANIAIYGFAVQTAVAGLTALMEATGTRGLTSVDQYVVSTAAGYPAFLADGQTHNCEDNYWLSPFFSGDPGLQIGTTTEIQHCNDNRWANVTAEGLWTGTAFVVQANSAAVKVLSGTNNAFDNFYSRGDSKSNANAYQIWLTNTGTSSAATNVRLTYGGEQRSVTSGTAGGLWLIDNGFLQVDGGSVSQGSAITIQTVASAQLVLTGKIQFSSQAVTINQSNGKFQWGEDCNMTQVTFNGTGGTVIPPSFNLVSTGAGAYGFASWTSAGQVFNSPQNITLASLSFLANPPISGTPYTNNTGRFVMLLITCTTSVALTVTLNATGQSAISWYSGTPAVGASVLVPVPQGAQVTITTTIADFTFTQLALRI